MSVKIQLLSISLLLYSWSAHSAPRLPDEVFDDLDLYFDITLAIAYELDVSDPAVLAQHFPDRTFEEFDRNKSGTFSFDPNADFIDSAETDLTLATQQFNHDTVDYDGDGLSGFMELECAFAERADGSPPITLDPTLTSSDATSLDRDLDCDGDSVSNLTEVSAGFDPLNNVDATLDYDQDGLTNAQELNLGTDPYAEDSDADGVDDATEIGGDPDDPLDADNNGVIDALESYWENITAQDLMFVTAAATQSDGDFALKTEIVVSSESASAAYTLKTEITP